MLNYNIHTHRIVWVITSSVRENGAPIPLSPNFDTTITSKAISWHQFMFSNLFSVFLTDKQTDALTDRTVNDSLL